MLSLSPYPSFSPSASKRSRDKRWILERSPTNKSLCSHQSKRFRRRQSSGQTDSNGSDIGIEDLASTTHPSCAEFSEFTADASTVILSTVMDLSSSFTIVEEIKPIPGCDIQTLQKRKQTSPLHQPKNAKHLLALLQKGYDSNQRDQTHDESAPIHTIVRSTLRDRSNCLETLLVHGQPDVNACDAHGMTALHFAAMVGDLRCVKLLLSFGANINAISSFDQTPMNLAIAHYQENVIKLFSILGGISAAFVMEPQYIPLPKVTRFHGVRLPFTPDSSDNELENAVHMSYNVPMDSIRPFDIQFLIEERYQSCFSVNEEEAVSMILNQREPYLFHQDIPEIMHTLTYQLHNGSRVLCLDGTGIRGLILIEVLEHLVEITGQEVTDMFDIICGSSVGALLALGLVYGKKSLRQLRQLLYKFRDEVFNPSCSEVCRIEQMEMLLLETFGTSLCMCDIKEPKVMIFSVNMELVDLKLQAFSNFLDDELAHEQVLRVARYAISNPLLFSNCQNYIDASVIANNPCDYMLTRLQYYYYQRKEQCPISLVVSVGTGVYSYDRGKELPVMMVQRSKLSKETYNRLQNLLVLMKHSIVQSESVAKSCQYRCQQLGIPFYRFSPQLREKVSVYDTETRKLLNSVLRTRLELQNSYSGLEKLREYMNDMSKSYTASGGGLCINNVPSDVTSPSELVPHPASSDTTSSGEELQRIHFLKTQTLTLHT